MDKPTKILLAGATLSALIVASGWGFSEYAEFHLDELVGRCKAQNIRIVERAQKRQGGKESWEDDPLICDPSELGDLSNSAVGIQADIITANRRVNYKPFNWAMAAALVVFVLVASPYSWYFLLRRIRELRDAIVGK